MKKNILRAVVFLFSALALFAQEGGASMSARSRVDWTRMRFDSTVELDTLKAGIPLPAGKRTAVSRMEARLPLLVKDALLSLNVDNRLRLGDCVLDHAVTLEKITDIIEESEMSSCVFKDETLVLSAEKRIDMNRLGAPLVRQKHPYSPKEPMKMISSRAYSGIIIDARGTLPVQGEYVSGKGEPCFFPKIWNESMDIVYERDMMENEEARKNGIARYGFDDDVSLYSDRIGGDPFYAKAQKIFGRNRTDIVIGDEDALRILTVKGNRELLREGKVVILLDKDSLVHDVLVPQKDSSYYVDYKAVKKYIHDDEADDIEVTDSPAGIMFSADFKFLPDSPELLPSEKARIGAIADALRDILKDNSYTVLVEGYAAEIGKPEGELRLSIERTRAIMDALISHGLPAELFSYRGYGGTDKFGDNSTDEGRRKNRRVDITARPKAVYIQRDWR